MSATSREAIRTALHLRRAEGLAGDDVRAELAPVSEFLERLAGRTVSRAEAARLLGISQTALNRWIERDEIPSVLTPEGRREVPVRDLIELLDAVERARSSSAKRPVTAAIRERRQSAKTVDVDRLLPPRRRRSHRTAELQGLAYHRLVAERLDEAVVAQARRRLARWRDESRIDPRWADEWERLLALPLPRIATAISADSPRGRQLRQSSPLAGLLTEQERLRLVRAVESRSLG